MLRLAFGHLAHHGLAVLRFARLVFGVVFWLIDEHSRYPVCLLIFVNLPPRVDYAGLESLGLGSLFGARGFDVVCVAEECLMLGRGRIVGCASVRRGNGGERYVGARIWGFWSLSDQCRRGINTNR